MGLKLSSQTKVITFYALIATSALSTPVCSVEIEPPKIQLVDKYGVNMANGQVTHSMGTVSIGGALGLADSISVYGNEFNFIGYRGFSHKYFAVAKDVQLVPSADPNFSPHNVMRVYGPEGSADFAYYANGVLQNNGDFTTSYTYVALGDERNILEVVGNDLVWTRPNGTILRFDRGLVSPKKAMSGGQLTRIEYPNGFTITITSLGMSVNTNTGFQLKQAFESDPNYCAAYPGVRTSDESSWSIRNPRHVYAINSAVEYCHPTDACNLAPANNNWPRATFDWPHCMPDIMFRANNQMNVTDSRGVVTTYKFTRYDLAYDEFGGVVAPYTPNTQFSPRLSSVSPPNNSAGSLVSYTYKNLFAYLILNSTAVDYRLQTAGVARSATRSGVGTGYDIGRVYMSGPDRENTSGGSPGVGVSYVRVLGFVNGAVGAIDYADTDVGRVFFEHTPRNFPTQFLKIGAPQESYGYTRGNLTSVSYNSNLPTGYFVAAEFPATCTPSTRKSCNQATRMRDANGNWTDYTYHAESGQVQRITYPANKHSVRPETRLEYQKRCAHYKSGSNTWTRGTPIWLKTAEKYCIKSAANGGACSQGDEVVTQFEYNHNNLLLTDVTVTAPGSPVLRTCYQYDKYGNQIAVTTPNANLASCPGSVPNYTSCPQ